MWDYYPFKIAFTPFDHILEAKVHCRGEIRARDLTETTTYDHGDSGSHSRYSVIEYGRHHRA